MAYLCLSRLDHCPRQVQRDTLMSCMSIEMQDIVAHQLGFDDGSDHELLAVLDGIQLFARSRNSITVDRLNFSRRVQREGESLDSFVADLRVLHSTADMCAACRDQTLHMQIMLGLKSDKTRSLALEREPPPSLQELITLARACETASKTVDSITGRPTSPPPSLQPISAYRRNQRKQSSNPSTTTASLPPNSDNSFQKNRTFTKPCRNCARFHDFGKCPAKDLYCKYCNKKGHFQRACRSAARKTNTAAAISTDDKTNDQHFQECHDDLLGDTCLLYTSPSPRDRG